MERTKNLLVDNHIANGPDEVKYCRYCNRPMEPNAFCDCTRTFDILFYDCSSECELEQCKTDLTISGYKIIDTAIKENENIFIFTVEVPEDSYNRFLEVFKDTESYQLSSLN